MSQIDDGVVQFGIDMALYDRYATLIFAYLRRQVSSQQDADYARKSACSLCLAESTKLSSRCIDKCYNTP